MFSYSVTQYSFILIVISHWYMNIINLEFLVHDSIWQTFNFAILKQIFEKLCANSSENIINNPLYPSPVFIPVTSNTVCTGGSEREFSQGIVPVPSVVCFTVYKIQCTLYNVQCTFDCIDIGLILEWRNEKKRHI